MQKHPIENAALFSAIVAGLTCLNIWPDLVGHASAFFSAAALVGAITNGRVFFNLGLGLTGALFALYPRQLAAHDGASLATALVASVAASLGYAACGSLAPPTLMALFATLVGMGYGLLLVRFMCTLAQIGSMSTIVAACIASLILKTALDMVLASLEATAQVATTTAMPILCVASLLVAQKVPERGGAPP